MADFCQLWLTCDNKAEATKIAKVLLNKRLIACAKQLPVIADYWWKNTIEHTDEVLLVMESKLDLFNKVETEITKLHSFETFVLEATPLPKISRAAKAWLSKEVNSG